MLTLMLVILMVALGSFRYVAIVLLTAVSTVLGLIPIAPTVFWRPMAFAIMGGLLAATMLTLVFLSAVYLAVFGREDALPRAAAVNS